MRLSFALGTFVAALIGSAVGIFLVLPLGLIASEFVIFPLALGVAGILASVCAAWAGNFLAGDGTRTRLLRVVWGTEVVAAFVAVVVLGAASLRVVLLGPLIYVAIGCTVALGTAACVRTWRFRSAERVAGEGRLTLVLLALAVVSVPAAIFLAWLAGLTGA
ncbi:MAG TPA: hypothetical protein VF952_20145 [Chloroflexia bacterium]|jgi:hypothetical protein